MKIIGVTGGIGAGKSSVSGLLKEMGAYVLDADLLSHQVVEPGKPAWARIRETFGEDVIQKDGNLDRKKLAQIVFTSEPDRRELESIIHTEVIHEIQESIKGLSHSGYNGVVVLDVPIPVRHGFLDTVDEVWVVVCNEEERIRRVIKRSGITADEAIKRIKSQLTQEEYIKLADAVISNNGSPDDLKMKVSDLYGRLVKEL